jgi:DnaJ-domain-containing protein 1
MSNPFAFFGLNPGLNIDAKSLRKAYLDIQRGSHPDLATDNVDANSVSEQANAHYQLLLNPLTLVKAYLDLLDNSLCSNSSLPPDFLMEMMDLSDAIEEMDRKDEQSMANVESQWNVYATSLQEEFVSFQNQENPNVKALAEWYQKSKYIQRLRKNFDGIVEI